MSWEFDNVHDAAEIRDDHLALVQAVTGAVPFQPQSPDFGAAAVKLADRPRPWFEDQIPEPGLFIETGPGQKLSAYLSPPMTAAQPWFGGRPRPSPAAFLVRPRVTSKTNSPEGDAEEDDAGLVKSVAAVKTPLETWKEGADSIFEASIDLRQGARLIAIYHSLEDKHRWMGWVDGETHWLKADGPWLFGWTHSRVPALRANDGVLVVDRSQGVLRLLLANRMPHDPTRWHGDLCDVRTKGLSLVLRFEDDEGHCRGITSTLRLKEIEQIARTAQEIAP